MSNSGEADKVAIVLVRGNIIGLTDKVKRTLLQLNLRRKNSLVIVSNSKTLKGMLHVIKDVATFGTVSDEFISEIMSKRKNFSKKKEGYVFHLNPARGGFGRKGIKLNFLAGGALGDRKEKISLLIKKML
ncbi:MAG: uL30 family ribosomal protein [Candidatus Woesearchaeota archaeon]